MWYQQYFVQLADASIKREGARNLGLTLKAWVDLTAVKTPFPGAFMRTLKLSHKIVVMLVFIRVEADCSKDVNTKNENFSYSPNYAKITMNSELY